jgi:glycosyltransferase involved in cell wall biosynthesis
VVVPVYNSAPTLVELTDRLRASLSAFTEEYEIVFVNDGSRDASWDIIQSLSRKDDRIIPIRFTRNYGQHNAIMCGFTKTTGDYVITLDDDLQHPPEEIPKLIAKIQQGYDVVYGTHPTPRHGWFRNIASGFLRRLLKLAIPDLDSRYSAFRILRSEIAHEIEKFSSPFNFVDGYISWVTQNVTATAVELDKRAHGQSGYTLKKLVGHTINILTTFSTLPVRLATGVGIVFSCSGMLLALYYLAMKFLFSEQVPPGYTSIIITILLSHGIVLLVLGVLGEYIAKVNFRSTNKAKYIIRK